MIYWFPGIARAEWIGYYTYTLGHWSVTFLRIKKSLRIFNFWQDSKKKSLHKKLERWDVTIAKCSQGRLVPRLLTRQSVTSQSVTRSKFTKTNCYQGKIRLGKAWLGIWLGKLWLGKMWLGKMWLGKLLPRQNVT